MLTKNKTDYHVTLADAKDHLNIESTFTDKDAFINDLIKSAVIFCENYIDKDIALTTSTWTSDDFSGCTLEIPSGNVISITSVQDEDSNDLTYDDEPVQYYDSHFVITLDDSVNEKDVTVIYQSGYSNLLQEPLLKTVILMKVADFYDTERSGYNFVSTRKSGAIENILDNYKSKRVKYIR